MATVYFNYADQNASGTKIKGSLALEEDGIKIVKEARAAQVAFGMLGAALAGQGDTTTIYYRDIVSATEGDDAGLKNGVVIKLHSGETVGIKLSGFELSADEILEQVRKKISDAAAHCPVCGAELEPGSAVCGSCGASIEAAESTPDTAEVLQNSASEEENQTSASYVEKNTEKKGKGGRIAFIVVGIPLALLLRTCANSML